jgi:AmmeMemoRadiSam system protein A
LAKPGQDVLSAGEQALLLDTAADALEFAVLRGGTMATVPERYPPALQRHASAFVTLHHGGQLRGCIGSLEPTRPLVAEVAENAAAAATRDDRFPPIRPEEIEATEIEISVLGTPVPLDAAREADLLAQLRPHRDGLILEAPPGRATFLPTVWEQLPQPGPFLEALKHKAGWPPGYWSADVRAYRYETVTIGPC